MCRVSIFTKFDRHFKFSFQTEFHIEFYRITQKLVMKFSMIHKDQYLCIFPFFYHLRSQFEILRDVNNKYADRFGVISTRNVRIPC